MTSDDQSRSELVSDFKVELVGLISMGGFKVALAPEYMGHGANT